MLCFINTDAVGINTQPPLLLPSLVHVEAELNRKTFISGHLCLKGLFHAAIVTVAEEFAKDDKKQFV